MILAIFFIATINCTKSNPPEIREKWKEEVAQAHKDLRKESTAVEEKGSKQSEDVEDLEEQNKLLPITLTGYVSSEAVSDKPISITFTKETYHVEGEITLWWYEEIEASGEGGEDHHSHNYTCVVKLDKGMIWGTFDENGNIKATISGFTYSDYGYPESGQSTPEICSLCMDKIEKKSVNFILNGNYQEKLKRASGSVLPKGWAWFAN